MIRLNNIFQKIEVSDLKNKENIINIKSYALLKLLKNSVINAKNVNHEQQNKCNKMLDDSIYKFDEIMKTYNIKFENNKVLEEIKEISKSSEKLFEIGGYLMANINHYYKYGEGI